MVAHKGNKGICNPNELQSQMKNVLDNQTEAKIMKGFLVIRVAEACILFNLAHS